PDRRRRAHLADRAPARRDAGARPARAHEPAPQPARTGISLGRFDLAADEGFGIHGLPPPSGSSPSPPRAAAQAAGAANPPPAAASSGKAAVIAVASLGPGLPSSIHLLRISMARRISLTLRTRKRCPQCGQYSGSTGGSSPSSQYRPM